MKRFGEVVVGVSIEVFYFFLLFIFCCKNKYWVGYICLFGFLNYIKFV